MDPAVVDPPSASSFLLNGDVDAHVSCQEQGDLDASALSLRLSLLLGSLGSEGQPNQIRESGESDVEGPQMDEKERSSPFFDKMEDGNEYVTDNDATDDWEFDMQWDEYTDHKFGGEGDPAFFAKATKRKSGGAWFVEVQEDRPGGKLAKKPIKGGDKENNAKAIAAKDRRGGTATKVGVKNVRQGGPKGVSQAPMKPTTVGRKGVTANERGILKVHNAFNTSTAIIVSSGGKATVQTSAKKTSPIAIASEEGRQGQQVPGSIKPEKNATKQSKNMSFQKNKGTGKAWQTKTKES
jgi:hypothetical protein